MTPSDLKPRLRKNRFTGYWDVDWTAFLQRRRTEEEYERFQYFKRAAINFALELNFKIDEELKSK